jgi:AcrR family transcriptional regulator
VSDIAPPVPSRRDEQKRRTTIALREAALQLFATRGFDATTTEDIAERAGVAVRTFFRYFPTKESVLHSGETTWVRAAADEYLSRPADVSDLDALRDSLVSAAPRLAAARETLFLYKRAVATSPVLQGREQDGQRSDAALIAGAIAQRHGLDRPDERCGLLAEVFLVIYRRALATWLEGSASADLAAGIRREFDLLGTIVVVG